LGFFVRGVPIRLIALDATNKVPIDANFCASSNPRRNRTPVRVVAGVLKADHETIDAGSSMRGIL